jgi:hypothetical protein
MRHTILEKFYSACRIDTFAVIKLETYNDDGASDVKP